MPDRLQPDERVAALEQRLHVPFPDRRLGLAAVTHKSYLNEHPGEGVADYERLEFLGDAVIDLAISHRLMERFPQASEGDLSQARSQLVNEESLAKVATALGLGELILLGKGEERSGGRKKSSVLADALEAVIGAIYLCHGLAEVLALVDRHFSTALDGVTVGRNHSDYKTRLQEEVQLRLQTVPRYRVVGESGAAHEKVFEVEVLVGDAPSGRATGRNRKEAEQAAAREALARLAPSDTSRSS